jgi:transposase
MAKSQKKYPADFKQQLVDLYTSGNYTYPQLEREYGVARSSISNWVKNASPITTTEGETVTLKDYKSLQKSYQNLKLENEILKKATAIFAREQ